jgi:acetylornithine deacetylase
MSASSRATDCNSVGTANADAINASFLSGESGFAALSESTHREWIAQNLCDFIAIRSLSEQEQPAIAFLQEMFEGFGWEFELLPVDETRHNIFVSFGVPKVLFTTHVDVVPAPDRLFTPTRENGEIHGRGSNDAKGIVIAMIAAARQLLAQGASDFALLFVLEEETSGNGALAAAQSLQGRGVQFIVNGEPTDGKLAVAHKGGVSYEMQVSGVSCHSGYPELGKSASELLITVVNDLLNTDFGTDDLLGKSTINIGTLKSGTASNVVPDSGSATFMIRTVDDNQKVKQQVEGVVAGRASLTLTYDARPVRLTTAEGFDTVVVNYCTDVPQFDALQAQCFLYGPGTIHRAHTDFEFVKEDELWDAVQGYTRLYQHIVGK